MGYVAKVDIRAMSVGVVKKAGARIGDDELPPKLREQLLAEGVIEEVGLSADSGSGLNGLGDELLGIEGVDEGMAMALHGLGFHTMEAVAGASVTALTALAGVGRVTAQKLIEAAGLALIAEEAGLSTDSGNGLNGLANE